ncbi:MAG: FtsW/RodA/SpoVE family cell cycle protein [Coriobacteriales bacterium]|nr:FtsW/RodA/SpoVE family cell cycle protein [Coriobacteriales bacterium]
MSRTAQQKAPKRITVPRWLLIISVVLLVVFGLVMVYSAGSIDALKNRHGDMAYYFKRQLFFVVFGLALIGIICKVTPMSFWQRPKVLVGIWAALVFLLALVMTPLGIEGGGARRWIWVGFSLQPSELARIVIILGTAGLLGIWGRGQDFWANPYEDPIRRSIRFTAIAFIMLGVPCAFVFIAQSDLGTTILILVAFFAALWFGEVDWRIIAILGLAVLAIGAIGILGSSYRRARVLTFIHTSGQTDIPLTDENRQSRNSLFALGSGGLTGTGLGMSREKYFYLSEAHTDFIFAIIGEELGLLFGTIPIILLFCVFTVSGILIAREASDMSGRIIAGACTTAIALQAILNMMVVCGLFPITGKTLPFVSYGGSSMLSNMIMLGFILKVSFDAQQPNNANVALRKSMRVMDGGERETALEPRRRSRYVDADSQRREADSQRRYDSQRRGDDSQPRFRVYQGGRSGHDPDRDRSRR